jgi:hypothetical protein
MTSLSSVKCDEGGCTPEAGAQEDMSKSFCALKILVDDDTPEVAHDDTDLYGSKHQKSGDNGFDFNVTTKADEAAVPEPLWD